MAIKYQSSKYAFHTVGESLTEPEFQKDCDINVMFRRLHQGQPVSTKPTSGFGYDDTTLDGLSFRIQKQRTEEELAQIAKTHEFTEEELRYIPEKVKKKFSFRQKKAAPAADPKKDGSSSSPVPTSPKVGSVLEKNDESKPD